MNFLVTFSFKVLPVIDDNCLNQIFQWPCDETEQKKKNSKKETPRTEWYNIWNPKLFYQKIEHYRRKCHWLKDCFMEMIQIKVER